MMKNKYTKEFEDFVRENISKYTKEDFMVLLENKFKIKVSYHALRAFLRRHKIECRYTNYEKNKIRARGRCPIGTERETNFGVYVKVAEPNVWEKKTRVMYEKYHNCKLSDDDYILFLNQDRNDYSKENLYKSSNREQCYLHNWGTFSSNPNLTKISILSARLTIKAKEVKNG